jgi:CBS domain-containing protein
MPGAVAIFGAAEKGGGMKLVQHLLASKDASIISIQPDASVLDAIKLMAEKGIGSLIVLVDGALVGIVTERDYARKVIIKGKASDTTPVADIMTAEVITASSTQTVNECMEMMTKKKCRHLPVVDDGELIGLISIGDLVQAIITDQQEEIEQLEHYIAG